MGKLLIIKGADFSSVALGTVPIGYPTITILDGMVTITLDGAENIYYTIDGSIPTKNSTKYTEPFTVEDRTTIKAIAEFIDGSVSKVSSLTYYSGGNRSITVVAEPTNAGTVSGAGEYQYGERVTISATPNEGYEFKQWNDGVTANPRVIRAEVDETYTAIFEDIVKRVDVVAEPTNGGTVTGSGFYPKGTEITVTASPNSGYKFLRWSDGNTESSRTITVEDNITFTAIFEQQEQPSTTTLVTVVAKPTNGGDVTGGGEYSVGEEVTLTASPADDYNFKQWNDGVTEATRTITVGEYAVTYTAIFEKQKGSIIVSVTPEEGGTVSGAGDYPIGTEVTLVATPNDGYKFEGWDLSSTTVKEPTLKVSVTKDDINIIASFVPETPDKTFVQTMVIVSPEGGGIVEGINWSGGHYNPNDYVVESGTEVTLLATPNEGYNFKQWNDGVTDNPRVMIAPREDTTYTAIFEQQEQPSTTRVIS